MNVQKILTQSWNLVWRHRALWLFGAILALTTVNGIYLAFDPKWDLRGEPVAIQLTDDTTIYLPLLDSTIDLPASGAPLFHIDDPDLEELQRFFAGELTDDWIPRGIWAILIALGIIAASMAIVGVIARYVAEVALIRMVNEGQETGEKPGIRRGLRLGFSRSAWRLLIIDIVLNLPVLLVLGLGFVLALLPLVLWALGSAASSLTGTLLTASGLFLIIFLSVIVSAVLSLFAQVMRRVCALEGLGVFDSIGHGLGMVRRHFKEVALIWLIWIGTRLAWMALSIPVIIILSPILLLFLVAGVAVGAVPALLVGGLLTTTLAAPFAWAVGALAGLPILLPVTLAPVLFVGGLVEVFKSSTWTLAYRELRALELAAADKVPAAGTALEAASAG
jgi:hypothetical protein